MNTKRTIALGLILLTLIGTIQMAPTVAGTAAGPAAPAPVHAPAPPPARSPAAAPVSPAADETHNAQPAARPVPTPPGTPQSSGRATDAPWGAALGFLLIVLTAGGLFRAVLRAGRHAAGAAVTYRPTVAKGVS